MNGVHDMGGMHGFGPIDIETDEPVFHEEWEGRVYGMVTSIREEHDVYGPLGSRHYIENIPPARYLASSYYERWMLALQGALVNKGLLTAEEIDARTRQFAEDPSAETPRRNDPELAGACGSGFTHRSSWSRRRSRSRDSLSGTLSQFGISILRATLGCQGTCGVSEEW